MEKQPWEKQTWWNNYAEEQINTFKNWVGDENAESKNYMVNYLKDKSYRSLFDAGCGNATFYNTLVNNNINIKYTGIDSCSFFIKYNQGRGIEMIDADIRDIPINDSVTDITFSRHTFEHQSNFKDIMNELIRISSKEMAHIFFIKPSDEENIVYTQHDNLYHNRYSKNEIDIFLKNHFKVNTWKWININNEECALHIYLK